MKKALALVLTFCMLLSCVALSVSAAREFTVTETTDTRKAIGMGGGSFVGYAYNDPFIDGDYTAEFVVKSNLADFGDGMESTGFCNGSPVIKQNEVGYVGAPANVAYTFADDTWYTIEYVVSGDTTTVKVNGEVAGTIAQAMPCNLYGSWYRMYLDSFKYVDADGDVVIGEDFENGATSAYWSVDPVTLTKTTTEITNKNVAYATKKAIGMGGGSFVGYAYNDPFISGDYTATFVVKSCMADFEGGMESTGFCNGSPVIKQNEVGYVGAPANVAYDFADDTWYTIEYVVSGDTTTVKVNGEVAGTIAQAMPCNLYGSWYRMYLDSFKYVDADGDVVIGADYEDGATCKYWSVDPVSFAVKGSEYDLGNWFWMFEEGSSYNPVVVSGVSGDYVVEMDICLDTDSSKINNWDGLADAAYISTTAVGAGKATLPYDFKVGTWYHVKWDVSGDLTDIYVDDVYLGRVNDAPSFYDGNQAFWVWDKISVDNVVIGDFEADMENGPLNDGQGTRLQYDFGIVEEDPLKDVPKYEAGGEALLVESSVSAAYTYAKLPINTDQIIISYDLAFVPNVENENNEDGVRFEFWRDGGYKRFNVGLTGAGRDEDMADYAEDAAWGEATYDNFHNVVLWFENGRGKVYVDGVEMYDGLCGSPFDGAFLMQPINASVILDNFYVYNTDMELIADTDDLVNGWQSDSHSDPKMVDVDAADFCAANGHIYYSIKRTKTETCTATGLDSTYCAVCGDVYVETTIPMVAHQYSNFDRNRVADGYYYADCNNCGGARVYSKVPAEDTYTGEIVAYFDMSTSFLGDLNNEYATPINAGFFGDQFRYEDGKAVLDADSYLANYSEFQIGSKIASKVDANDWSYSFRMTYNGLWDTDDVLNSGYNHAMYFWLRGVSLELGYDADAQELYIGPSANPGAVAIEKITTPYEFKEGLTYTFKFGLRFIEEDDELELYEYADIAIWINDELVLIHSLDETGYNIFYDCAFDSDKIETIYPRNFGFAYAMDDLVIGSYDFAWNKVAGDVDNDGVLSVADAMVMRKYLAKVIDDEAVFVDLMDVNEDAVVNAKDQLAIRKALAA